MKRYIFIIPFLCLLLCLFQACDKKKEVGLYSIYQLDKYKNPVPKPVVTLADHWQKQEGLTATFPKGVEVYRSTQTINNKGTKLYLVAFNPKANIEFKPVLSTTAKTPSQFFADEPGTVYASINAGFFFGTSSLSLVLQNNVTASVNVKSLTRTLNGANATYYPTRAAFGLNKDLVPAVAWVYSVGTGNGELYAYPQPSPNEEGKAPQAVPTAAFPAGGALWQQTSAIGGSPMLVKDSVVNITDIQELIAVDNTSSRARSAIGYLKNGNIVLVAAEGGTPTTAPGLTLKELAQVMLEAGCVGAINLDGGGSSSLIVDGQQTIKPSDTAGERKVMSAILVKKK